jgi:F0F1-type ATP synthase gamma subunit
MGKKAQIQGDLDDVEALLEIITVLKDVSTNRFFAFAQQKENLARFLEQFLYFFNMLEAAETNCELVRNQNPATDIVVVSSESSFMAQLNGRICNAAAKEAQKHPDSRVICVGWRAADKLKSLGLKIEKMYTNIDVPSRYDTAMRIRDFLIERVMSGRTGRALCIYTWAKSFNILKPRLVKLLPASELLGGEEEEGEEVGAAKSRKSLQFIQESEIDGIMKVLADIWVSSRLFELLSDTKLAESAAQAQQLESSIESLSKEKKGLALGLKKAQRGDLNKAMREVFVSSSIAKGGRR